MKPRMHAGPLALAFAFALCAASASADPFSYRDRDGHVHRVAPATPPEVGPAPGLPASPDAAASPDDRPWGASAHAPGRVFPYSALVVEAAHVYALPPALVRAVMEVESNYRPFAVSRVGARGLMQLMPATAEELGVLDSFDPQQNVMGGTRLLRMLINVFDGDVSLALAGYHAGAGSVRRAGGIPPIVATQRYVVAVLAAYHRFGGPGSSSARPPAGPVGRPVVSAGGEVVASPPKAKS